MKCESPSSEEPRRVARWSASDSPRTVAARIVAQWLRFGDFPDRLLENVPARGFVTECVYGVVRRHRALEWTLAPLRRIPGGETETATLLVALYELLYMREPAFHAVVNHAVEQIKRDRAGSTSFANAALRRVVRERDAILAALAAQPVGIRESHPEGVVERWTRAYGIEETERICVWNNTSPETIVAVMLQGAPRKQWMDSVREAGIAIEPHPFAPETYFTLPRGLAPNEAPGYRDGAFIVQDPACSVPVDLLDVRPGQSVLDSCAAPGGKTAMLARALDGKGRLTACDVHDDRLETLRDTLGRLRLGEVDVRREDALRPSFPRASFDRILLDVPCSNSGVFRRRADARWRFSPERLTKLCRIQGELLSALTPLLTRGGRLVYSSCSIEPEENEGLVNGWLAEHPEWMCVESRRRLPGDRGTDGAFAAALERRARPVERDGAFAAAAYSARRRRSTASMTKSGVEAPAVNPTVP